MLKDRSIFITTHRNKFNDSDVIAKKLSFYHKKDSDRLSEIRELLDPANWREFIDYIYFNEELRKEIRKNEKLERMLEEQKKQIIIDSNKRPMGAYGFLEELWKVMGMSNAAKWPSKRPHGQIERGKYTDWELNEEKKHNEKLKEEKKKKK